MLVAIALIEYGMDAVPAVTLIREKRWKNFFDFLSFLIFIFCKILNFYCYFSIILVLKLIALLLIIQAGSYQCRSTELSTVLHPSAQWQEVLYHVTKG